MNNWKTIDTVPMDKPVIVKLEKSIGHSLYHVGVYNKNMNVIGNHFDFDMPKATHWCEIPQFDGK